MDQDPGLRARGGPTQAPGRQRQPLYTAHKATDDHGTVEVHVTMHYKFYRVLPQVTCIGDRLLSGSVKGEQELI